MTVSTGLLGTKCCPPPPRSRERSAALPYRLAQLDPGLSGRLTFLSTPASHEITAIVCTWAAASKQPGAWLALEHGEHDRVCSGATWMQP